MKAKNNNILIWSYRLCLLVILFGACSTTKNLPEGEVLYTGIKEIEVTEKDNSAYGKDALGEVESALKYPPNNALLGSSSIRTPLPVGLWIYNAFVNKEGKVSQWIFKRFAAKPVFISTVNPDVRTKVAYNLLRENSYFDGYSSFEVLPDEKNERKAKIKYVIDMNHSYTYDSIYYTRMRHAMDTLIRTNIDKTVLHKDDPFNVSNLEAERSRLSVLMRNNGFYYFRPDFLVYQADTTITPGKVWLRMVRKEGLPGMALRPWNVGDISVWLNGYYNEQPTDSVQYKDLTIHYQGKLRIRPGVLYNRIKFRPGDLYTQEKQDKTQTALSQLGVFRYAEMQFQPRDSASRRNNLLDLQIHTVYDLPLNGEFEVNVTTKSNDQTGPGAIFNLTKQNMFRGGEIFGVQLKGSYEWNTGNRVSGSSGSLNSYELGVSTSLSVPKLLFPGFIHTEYSYPTNTTFRLYGDLLHRAGFFSLLGFGGSMTYDFQPTDVSRHTITAFRLTYNLLQSTTEAFDSITGQNPALFQSLQNQFIPAIGYTYTYDDALLKRKNHFWWQTSVSEAGNIINGLMSIGGYDYDEPRKRLFSNPFAQYLKGTTEARYTYNFNRNHAIASRAMIGAVYSYGNARVAPYSEQFFIGGANSIRAFTVRSIGPGRFVPQTNSRYAYLDQTGEFKVEANLEYRFRIMGDLHGATFLDTGNIWLLREDEARPGGRLKWGRFWKDLALGTGAGLRYDLDFLVIRLDVGIALHVPYDTGKVGYYNVPKFKDGIGWHLAVGYPF